MTLRQRTFARLVAEELEPRMMMDATTSNVGFALTLSVPAPPASALQAGLAASIAGFNPGLLLPILNAAAPPVGQITGAPDAASGVGQMTITTGANTLGISSFAFPIAGPSGGGGGTGNPDLSPPPPDVPNEFGFWAIDTTARDWDALHV